MEHKNSRDAYVDITKGIAMLLVVRIHTEVFSVINAPYPIVAVPLFFFLSGFYDNTNKPLKEWLPKTFRSIVITGIIWVIITELYLFFLRCLKNGAFSAEYLRTPSPGVMWFLFALFYAKCGMWLIHKSRLPVWITIPLLIVLGALISRANLPLLIGEGLAALPFYYLGRVLYPWMNKTNGGGIILALIGLACILLMPMSWFPVVLVPYSSSSLPIFMYPIYFTMTLLAFFPFLWFSNKIKNQTWLANYGKHTLGILVIHPLMLHTIAIFFNRRLIPGSTLWIALFLFTYIAVCILSYYCSVWINQRMPYLLGNIKKITSVH